MGESVPDLCVAKIRLGEFKAVYYIYRDLAEQLIGINLSSLNLSDWLSHITIKATTGDTHVLVCVFLEH